MNYLFSAKFNMRPIIAAYLLLWQLPVSAATFVVDTTSDLVDANPGDGLCLTANDNCALRAAVQEANALAGADSVTLTAGIYNLSLSGVNEDAAASGDLDIADTLTINGGGANQVFIDGMASDRIFQLLKDVTAVINGVTIRNGVADGVSMNGNSENGGFGGGIKSEGKLTINDCNIDRNTAFNGGGGIHAVYRGFSNRGSLTVNRSNITNSGSGGSAGGFGGHIYAESIPMVIRDSVLKDSVSSSTWGMLAGGGIYYSSTFPYPEALVYNTTISNNRVMSSGGGIHVSMGEMDIINSTISGNAAYDVGGGLSVDVSATVNVVNSTIAYNSAPVSGGGINDANQAHTVTIVDSIISANIGGNCSTVSAGFYTEGSNLDSDGSCGFDFSNQDPLLLALADNGGPGFTHALAEGSPALNVAVSCLVTDQRSYLRPETACDLGAVEMEASAPEVPVATPFENNQVSSTNVTNDAPVAFDLPAAVTAGAVLYGIMNAYDPNGDLLSFEFTELPTKGNVGLPVPGSNNDIAGGYTYTPLANASGIDALKFRACDPSNACSDEKRIFITITSGVVSGDINIELTPSSGNINELVILSETELAAIAPDSTYSHPIGGYFFSVDGLPTGNGGTAASTVVTIELPSGAEIPVNAEVRKLDNTGVWQTVSNTASVNTSSAILDRVNKTIKLTLIDNDIFDLNPEVGIINDPVALAFVPTVAIDSDGDGDGVVDSNDAFPDDVTRAVNCAPGRYGAFECVNASPGYSVPVEGAIVQDLCAIGSYSNTAGSTQCTLASMGYFVATEGAIEQTACAAGAYSNVSGASECTLAAEGYFVATVAQANQAACAAGSYANVEGLTACLSATPGHYVALSGQREQTACDIGTYTNTAQSTACTLASPGYYVALQAATTQEACEAGTYETGTGSARCTLAAPGHFVADKAQHMQTACQLGHFSANSGATACVAADLGHYVDTLNATSALSCPVGTTTASTGATSAQACLAASNTPPAASGMNADSGGGGALGAWFAFALLTNVLVRRKFKQGLA